MAADDNRGYRLPCSHPAERGVGGEGGGEGEGGASAPAQLPRCDAPGWLQSHHANWNRMATAQSVNRYQRILSSDWLKAVVLRLSPVLESFGRLIKAQIWGPELREAEL